jgi:hypothetical protein
MSIVVLSFAINTIGFAQNKVVVVPLGGDDTSPATLYGRAPSSADQALLFEWPGTGVEIRTRNAGAGDSVFEVRIVNTNPPGGSSFYITTTGSSSSALNPGTSIKQGSLSGVSLLLTENKGSLGRMMRLHCFANVISGGDDGFVQCMGIPAGNP